MKCANCGKETGKTREIDSEGNIRKVYCQKCWAKFNKWLKAIDRKVQQFDKMNAV